MNTDTQTGIQPDNWENLSDGPDTHQPSPLPWQSFEDSDGIDIMDMDGNHIARIQHTDHFKPEANAKLIVRAVNSKPAADNMADALEEYLEYASPETLTLEQRFANVQRTLINEVNHHIQCQKDFSALQAHANKLAEALREAADWLSRSVRTDDQEQAADAREAIAAYESEVAQ